MSCGPDGVCATGRTFATAGKYVLRVTAPGFQSLTVDVTLKVVPSPPPPDSCECPGAWFEPLRVTIEPQHSTDAGAATDSGHAGH
jgi:hypothetical protein